MVVAGIVGNLIRSSDIGYEEFRPRDQFWIDPINRSEPEAVASLGHVPAANGRVVLGEIGGELRILGEIDAAFVCPECIDYVAAAPLDPALMNVRAHRSEERRVGKECRSRWSPYH